MITKAKYTSNTMLRLVGLILVTLGLISADYFIEIKRSKLLLENEEYNAFYERMPQKYLHFIGESPLDKVIDSNEERAAKNNALKYNAYLIDHSYARELVVLKKIETGDTTKARPVSFNIYPTDKSILKGDEEFLRFTTQVIVFSHNGYNYRVASQVLPNIAIDKIEPYSRYWKTTVSSLDTKLLQWNDTKVSRQLNNGDSLALALFKETDIYDFLFEEQLQKNNIHFLPKSLRARAALFSDSDPKIIEYLQSSGMQLIRINDDRIFWKRFTQDKILDVLRDIHGDSVEINDQMKSYLRGDIPFSEVIDQKKLAYYYVLVNLFSDTENRRLYLYFNEKNKLFEPFYIHKQLGTPNTYLKDLQIAEVSFLTNYVTQLDGLECLEEVHSLIDEYTDEIREQLNDLHRFDPTILFDTSLFQHNKLIIEKALNPSTTTKVSLVRYATSHMEIEVENLTNFPIEVSELSHKQNKFIIGPRGENVVIMPTEKKRMVFDLPDSFDNLFVQKKKKTTGFIFEKDIFDLFVGYSIVGTGQIKYNHITPFSDFDERAEADDIFRKESDLSQFDFIYVDDVKKEIGFASDSIVLNKPLLFPEGYLVKAQEGLKINILAGGKIISKSPLLFAGSANTPIEIQSSDGKGQGIFVVGAKGTSELSHVNFNNLTNQMHGLWDLTGAVVFYESPVNLDYVRIENNSCEDGLNIIRTHFTLSNSTIRNTQSDAFDGDFVQGTVSNCTFENLGNDAIDVSGSTLKLIDLKIIGAGDKALSAGEDSKMTGTGIRIDSSEIAVAGKDLSVVYLDGLEISNSKLGFTAFQKKPEFGSSDIEAKNVLLTQVETHHLIENRSSLLLNGELSATIDQVKEQMYGVEFGVDSKETRVKKE